MIADAPAGRRFDLLTPFDFVAFAWERSVRLDGTADALADQGLFDLAADTRREARALRALAERQERAALDHPART